MIEGFKIEVSERPKDGEKFSSPEECEILPSKIPGGLYLLYFKL